MTDHINLTRIVVSAEAPDYIQHMVTDLNDSINRLNAVITKLLDDVAVLQAWVASHGP